MALFIFVALLFLSVAIILDYTDNDPILKYVISYPLKFFICFVSCIIIGFVAWLFLWVPIMWMACGYDNTWYSSYFWAFFAFLGVYVGIKTILEK
jgi:hypothetical protein